MRIYTTLFLSLALGCSSSFEDNKGDPTGSDDADSDGGFEDGEPDMDGGSDEDADGGTDDDLDADGGLDSDGGSDGGMDSCVTGPSPGTVATLDSCEYTPSPSGEPFSARIEWAMTHGAEDPTDGTIHPAYTFAEHTSLDSVFQAPVVAQFTDDNGDGLVTERDTPDIAVLMGDEFATYETTDDKWSAIRIISGDGSDVHSTLLWDEYGGVEYSPYLFAGLASADIDEDGRQELTTVVRSESSPDICYAGIYEVDIDGSIALSVVSTDTMDCESHAPAVHDIDGDGVAEIILGSRVYDDSLELLWSGTDGEGWFNAGSIGSNGARPGYWNSGYHSMAYDMDADGSTMEIVAGSTVYNTDGSIYCSLTGGDVADGYPAVGDFNGDGNPEIVITGNHWVSVYSGTSVGGNCDLLAANVNDPYADTGLEPGLPAPPSEAVGRSAFGGQPTVADFTGDGNLEIGVAGSAWYSVFAYDDDMDLRRLAMTETRDWSSASTGATVFDFNGDGANEVVFSDEDAVYVWQVDESASSLPWERMITLLEDENHKSWTIHEYPLVADVDGDGKAEIVAVNSHLPDPTGSYTPSEHYGIYVLGASDDDWVSARSHWNQHAYYVTNVTEDGTAGYAPPNFAPHTAENYNSFRTQAPGSFGANAASNLYPVLNPCQEECGDLTVWVQMANESPYIGAREDLPVNVYGISGGVRDEIDDQAMPWRIDPGTLSKAIDFVIPSDEWSGYDSLEIVIDKPDEDSESGGANECDEDDNVATVDLSSFCP